MPNFSALTLALLALGWMSHWLISVRKARATAAATGQSLPNLMDYWVADWPTTWLSVIGVIVGYFVLPVMAARWPEVALVMGSTEEDPMNPLAAYLGGLFAPWLADAAGRRVAKMVSNP